MIYGCASLLKLLPWCKPRGPVAMCSERDEVLHPLKRPRTGDSVTCSSSSRSQPESPALNHQLRSITSHQSESMEQYLKDRLSRTRDVATTPPPPKLPGKTPRNVPPRSLWTCWLRPAQGRLWGDPTGPVGYVRSQQAPGGVFLDVRQPVASVPGVSRSQLFPRSVAA